MVNKTNEEILEKLQLLRGLVNEEFKMLEKMKSTMDELFQLMTSSIDEEEEEENSIKDNLLNEDLIRREIKNQWYDIVNWVVKTYEITEVASHTWLFPLTPMRLVGKKLLVSVPDDISKSYITKKYAYFIEEAIEAILGHKLKISLIVVRKTFDKSDHK